MFSISVVLRRPFGISSDDNDMEWPLHVECFSFLKMRTREEPEVHLPVLKSFALAGMWHVIACEHAMHHQIAGHANMSSAALPRVHP